MQLPGTCEKHIVWSFLVLVQATLSEQMSSRAGACRTTSHCFAPFLLQWFINEDRAYNHLFNGASLAWLILIQICHQG